MSKKNDAWFVILSQFVEQHYRNCRHNILYNYKFNINVYITRWIVKKKTIDKHVESQILNWYLGKI